MTTTTTALTKEALADGDALLRRAMQTQDAADLSVYADWLEEHARRPELLHALRWCLKRGKSPRVSPAGKVAAWSGPNPSRRKAARRPRRPESLPSLVFDQLRGGGAYKGRRYPGALAAYAALGDALDRLREAYEA